MQVNDQDKLTYVFNYRIHTNTTIKITDGGITMKTRLSIGTTAIACLFATASAVFAQEKPTENSSPVPSCWFTPVENDDCPRPEKSNSDESTNPITTPKPKKEPVPFHPCMLTPVEGECPPKLKP